MCRYEYFPLIKTNLLYLNIIEEECIIIAIPCKANCFIVYVTKFIQAHFAKYCMTMLVGQ